MRRSSGELDCSVAAIGAVAASHHLVLAVILLLLVLLKTRVARPVVLRIDAHGQVKLLIVLVVVLTWL